MKFINLLKKELSELINKQMIMGLVIAMTLFVFMGQIMKTTIDEAASETHTMNICDRDDTDFTKALITALKESDAEIKLIDSEGGDYAAILKDNDIKNLVIIPEGFTDTILIDRKPGELISISRMTSAATMSSLSNSNSDTIYLIESCVSSSIAMKNGMSPEDTTLTFAPITVKDATVVTDKSADISNSVILNKISIQNMILPMVVLVLIMMTSQSLITAISNEKLDKTLETLLSAPVSRTAVISAKMLAAAIVALINAVVYMIGFAVFVTGSTDTMTDEITSTIVGNTLSVETALVQLGLSLTITDCLLIGAQLFFTILICLSISIILGAVAEDSKSSQNMIMPIMMLAMIPFFVSTLTDITTFPSALRMILYAIPFTHTFMAMPNLMFGNNAVFFGGLIYQIAVFAVCMFFALRLFKSDKIFTISLNFGQKKKFRKNSTADNE